MRPRSAECLPENSIGGTKHCVLDGGPAHHRLMIVVVVGVFIGEPLQDRRVAVEPVEEPHRIATGTVIAGDADEWIKGVYEGLRGTVSEMHAATRLARPTALVVAGAAGSGMTEFLRSRTLFVPRMRQQCADYERNPDSRW
ncbi:MAG: hypothetical protein J2P54_23415, partial [Bradyrhizobiaceae bacterium]|nr:hypothetical protein [Bradyrhizobiaceae bacterium]